MTATVHVLNGPNINLMGTREPEIYGTTTLAEIEAMCRDAARGPLSFRQSNFEGEILDWLGEIDGGDGIIINPAGLTFRSRAIVDALEMFPGPVIELHISNIHGRAAPWRHSLVSPVATAVIAGLGARGYTHAVAAIYDLLAVRR